MGWVSDLRQASYYIYLKRCKKKKGQGCDQGDVYFLLSFPYFSWRACVEFHNQKKTIFYNVGCSCDRNNLHMTFESKLNFLSTDNVSSSPEIRIISHRREQVSFTKVGIKNVFHNCLTWEP